jgi:hypothetical protein
MNEDKPPSLFGQKIIFTDRVPGLEHQGDITLVDIRDVCVHCKRPMLKRSDLSSCGACNYSLAEITGDNHRETCGESE